MIALVIVLAWLLAGSIGLILILIHDDEDAEYRLLPLAGFFGVFVLLACAYFAVEDWHDQRWVRR